MRRNVRIGLLLLALGAAFVVASTGSFTTSVADRGVSIDTTPDRNALLGLEYPRGTTVRLVSGDADGGGSCFFFTCSPYEYDDVELIDLSDNTALEGLDSVVVTHDAGGDSMVGDGGIRYEPATGSLGTVDGDFECESSGFFGPGDQVDDSLDVAITIESGDDDFSIELTRDLTIDCVPD